MHAATVKPDTARDRWNFSGSLFALAWNCALSLQCSSRASARSRHACTKSMGITRIHPCASAAATVVHARSYACAARALYYTPRPLKPFARWLSGAERRCVQLCLSALAAVSGAEGFRCRCTAARTGDAGEQRIAVSAAENERSASSDCWAVPLPPPLSSPCSARTDCS
jgi:hypothetical protein